MSSPDPAAVPAAPAEAATPRPRRSKKRLLLFALPPIALLLGGGGYAWQSGLLAATHGKSAAHPGPKLNIDPDSDPAHPRTRTSYLKIEGAFTTNLRASPRFVQIEIGVATPYDPIILTHVQANEIPIRSAVLAVLAQQTEAVVTSDAGRTALQSQLRTAVNRVLAEKEGFGGISDVYLTGLVIQ